jgi:hypothetical protein
MVRPRSSAGAARPRGQESVTVTGAGAARPRPRASAAEALRSRASHRTAPERETGAGLQKSADFTEIRRNAADSPVSEWINRPESLFTF